MTFTQWVNATAWHEPVPARFYTGLRDLLPGLGGLIHIGALVGVATIPVSFAS